MQCCTGAPGQYEPLVPSSSHVDADELENTEDINTPSVIQFAAPLYLCTEADLKLKVNVVRLGSADGVASARFKTKDASAKAGVKFVGLDLELHFEPGETLKEIEVELIQDSRWDATLEFEMVLSHAKGASLGLYLYSCRAKIIDDDKYPTNNYEPTLKGAALMWEYVQSMMIDPAVRRSAIIHLAMDIIKGLYFFLTLYLQLYLIDVVLKNDQPEEHVGGEGGGEGERERELLNVVNSTVKLFSRRLEEEEEGEGVGFLPHTLLIPGSRRKTTMVIAALYIVPFALIHLVDVLRTKLEIPYALHMHTRSSLLDKFLNYKESERSNLNVGEMTMIMMRDTLEVCDMGFMKLLSVAGILIKLGFALIFIMAENRLVVAPLVCYPVVLGLFLICRERLTVEVNEDRAKKEDEVAQAVSETISNYRLIADFNLRRRAVDGYGETMVKLHHADRESRTVVLNNMYMAPWLTTLFVGMWILYGSSQMESFGGTVSLGAFIATINIFKEVGFELCEVYIELMEVQRAFGPLEKICCWMNKEVDLFERMNMLKNRQEDGQRLRQAARDMQKSSTSESPARSASGSPLKRSMSHPAFAVDTLDITIKDLKFQYGKDILLQNLNVSFPQGGMYAFVGPAHHGKSTLLKLLAGVHLPAEKCGTIFIPPHLRVLHISLSECLLNANLKDNVMLSASVKQAQGEARVREICRMVGFKPKILKHLETEDKRDEWRAMFSHTDYVRLNLARAFVLNPEVLVIHKPDCVFSNSEVPGIMDLLKRHVDERGLELPASGREKRRPRTVFFTATTVEGMKVADQVFKVERARGTGKDKTFSLDVTIISASQLRNADIGLLNGLSDPYCSVSIERGGCIQHGTTKRTETVKDNLNPEWNKRLHFDDITPQDVLVFEVKDKDTNKADDAIGSARVLVSEIADGETILTVSAKDNSTLKVAFARDDFLADAPADVTRQYVS